MAETRVDTGVPAKVTTSHSDGKPRHILSAESDALAKRISELVGDKKVSWFAKECGFGESLLRKYLTGAQPNTSNLVAMANVGGVTVDWLATGRPPKTRAELKAIAVAPAVPAPAPSDGRLETYRIAVEAVQAWQLEHDRFLTPDKLLQTLDLLVELSEGKPEQLKPLVGRVLRLAA